MRDGLTAAARAGDDAAAMAESPEMERFLSCGWCDGGPRWLMAAAAAMAEADMLEAEAVGRDGSKKPWECCRR